MKKGESVDEDEIKIIVEMPGHHSYPIRPGDVLLGDCGAINGGLGKAEVEAAAGNLVIFCQQRGGWYPFSFKDLLDFYERRGEDPKRMLYGLLGPWEDDSFMLIGDNIHLGRPLLVTGFDGMIYFTDLFIKIAKGE